MRAVAIRAHPGGIPFGAILGGLALASAAVVGTLHLDHLPFTVCLFKTLTGWPCFACGTTRALGRLALGDVSGAWAMNPLATLGAAALVPWGAADLVLLVQGRALAAEVSPRVGWILRVGAVALALANWAYLVAAGR